MRVDKVSDRNFYNFFYIRFNGKCVLFMNILLLQIAEGIICFYSAFRNCLNEWETFIFLLAKANIFTNSFIKFTTKLNK